VSRAVRDSIAEDGNRATERVWHVASAGGNYTSHRGVATLKYGGVDN
jgi:hypothetical protein